MKKILLILLVVVVAAASFVYSDPQLREDAMNAINRFLGKSTPASGSTVIYKWTDKRKKGVGDKCISFSVKHIGHSLP